MLNADVGAVLWYSVWALLVLMLASASPPGALQKERCRPHEARRLFDKTFVAVVKLRHVELAHITFICIYLWLVQQGLHGFDTPTRCSCGVFEQEI